MIETILIIDDEKDILDLLSNILNNEGYNIYTASNGREGIEKFLQHNPHLVISDVKMPNMDGLEVLKEIKSKDRNVEVIIMTGHSDEATAVKCLKNGAYDYFHKPLEDIEILLTAVRRVLEKRRLEIQNLSLIKQLEELSIKDSLTQAYNYRYLQTILDDEINRGERYGHSFFLLLMDADHFKKINDSFGHLFGDQVLKELCEIITNELRSTDRLFRYGGEEFIVIMNEITVTEISKTVERLQIAIRNHVFRYEEIESKITVSMGGAIYPDDAKDKINLIKIADQMLYKAKQSGRDRFECCSIQSLTNTFDNNVEKLPNTNLAAPKKNPNNYNYPEIVKDA